MTPNKKILIVEDEAQLLNLLYEKFTAAGYIVIKAMDGKDGLEKTLAERPDLIMLDINLPIMNGIEMLKRVRKDDQIKETEVMILTNYDDYHLVTDTLALGAHDYLIKSDWKFEDIIKMVDKKLR